MDQEDVGFAGRVRNHEVRVFGNALLKQALANETKLVGAKNMLADGEEIFLAIDQFERQHGPITRILTTESMILDLRRKCREGVRHLVVGQFRFTQGDRCNLAAEDFTQSLATGSLLR